MPVPLAQEREKITVSLRAAHRSLGEHWLPKCSTGAKNRAKPKGLEGKDNTLKHFGDLSSEKAQWLGTTSFNAKEG